ncbi:hypothetical protein BS614_24005 [Paenibacillus xylanexedens]|uniref:hypothetical protein n=1 Tax=Paenibacillus xylanexedens TaxID=528191 RepID=UPI0009382C4C|nr:hypothetical protein [Paenibacillus xylanexedens]APO46803.1 hypothetical protein BS614_24005 [Paenibacillus xylanexedens]
MTSTSTIPQKMITFRNLENVSAFQKMTQYKEIVQSASRSYSEKIIMYNRNKATYSHLLSYFEKREKVVESSSTTTEKDAFHLKEEKQRTRNLVTIQEIKKLDDNWNDNGAEKFEEELISTVISIVTFLDFQPYIFPTARKSIQLEYEKSNGDYLEMEIYKDKIGIYMELENGDETDREIPLTKYWKLNEILAEFNGSGN